jgi:hypothetical protein
MTKIQACEVNFAPFVAKLTVVRVDFELKLLKLVELITNGTTTEIDYTGKHIILLKYNILLTLW